MSTSRILSNFSSAFFLASGCWGDLLLIRVFLTCAYAFIIAFSFAINADPENYFWGFACLYLHGSSAVRLFFDEGQVKLDEKKEQDALWRYFYRCSGISRLLFKRYVAPCFELIDVKKGTALDTNGFFYIIFEGAVDIQSTVAGSTGEFSLVSGQSFDIKHLSPHFPVRIAYTKESQRLNSFANQDINATVSADAKIYRCSKESMNDLCSWPESKDASQGLLIATLSDMVEQLYIVTPSLPNDEENQLLKNAKSAASISTHSAVFAPLEHFEEPVPYLAGSGSFKGIHRHILHTLKVRFLLPWPLMTWLPGLRQIGSLPVPKVAPNGTTNTSEELDNQLKG